LSRPLFISITISLAMKSDTLPVEFEVGPRFEIFYALYALFAPPSPLATRWRKAARARLGNRATESALEMAPHPLMWAVLADSTLGAAHIRSFEDLIAAMDEQSPIRFKATIVSGAPAIRGTDLAATFETLLGDAEAYRRRLKAFLREFWDSGFGDDFAALQPELRRMERQLLSSKAVRGDGGAGEGFGIPVAVTDSGTELVAGSGGYRIPLARLGRIVVLPSAFNLHRWWTKRDDGSAPAALYFPVNDGTVVPNDAIGGAAAGTVSSAPRSGWGVSERESGPSPEVVFRALGDTTRYAIATILARAPATPTELARQLKVSKPTITHHVHSLRDAGLIIDGAEGGKLTLDRSRLEQLSDSAVEALFASRGKLKISKTRKRVG